MGKKKKESLSLTDIAAAWKAGWTPSEVNALLDRVDSMGDINSPDPKDEEDDEDEDIDPSGKYESDEDEDNRDAAEDDEDDKEGESNSNNSASKSSKRNNNSQDNNNLDHIEVENKRLKEQIQKLQKKNRSKDLSGDETKKTPEESLIDTIQSLFD